MKRFCLAPVMRVIIRRPTVVCAMVVWAMVVPLLAASAFGQSGPAGAAPAQQTLAQQTLAQQSFAQQRMDWAQAAIKEHADRSQPYNELAAAYVRRVRETGDMAFYADAESALQRSLALKPENIEAQKIRIMILLGRSKFAEALAAAETLNKKSPDDVLVYGLVADADIALGRYKDAEEAAQWMLDMRPGNIPGLLQGARLRSLYGDVEGSMDFFSQAYQQTPPAQTEDLAWILTQMADVQLNAGKVDAAEKLLRSALDKFSGYHLALASLARVQSARAHVAAASGSSR